MTPNRMKAIAIGGIAAGVASQIPIINFLNILCCALIVGGAILAVYLAFREEDASLTTYGSGALIGALTGVAAAIIGTLISIPLTLIFGNAAAAAIESVLDSGAVELEGPVRDLIESFAGSGDGLSAVALLFSLITSSVVYTIFGALGGVLGAAFFRKK